MIKIDDHSKASKSNEEVSRLGFDKILFPGSSRSINSSSGSYGLQKDYSDDHAPKLQPFGSAFSSHVLDAMEVSSVQDDDTGSHGILGNSSGEGYGGSFPYRRPRATFNSYQLARLESMFEESHYLTIERRAQLVQELNLTESIIQV